MSRADEAIKLHDKGYNCAQATACVFEDKTDLTKEQIFKITEGLGLGGGNMAGTCGAAAGADIIIGCTHSSANLEKPDSKKETYKISGEFQKRFVEKNGSLICRTIKGVDTGEVLTPCPMCIRNAVNILEEMLG